VAAESVAAESVAAEEQLAAQVTTACTAVPHVDTDNTTPGTADTAAAVAYIVQLERAYERVGGTPREVGMLVQTVSGSKLPVVRSFRPSSLYRRRVGFGSLG
jgi:hypothetical protein